MTDSNYFVAVDGKTSGPFKGQQIRNKLNQGKLLESDFIWREGITEWLPISKIMREIPGVDLPALPEQDAGPHSMLMEHPNELPPTEVEIPPKGIYEPPATLSQKNAFDEVWLQESRNSSSARSRSGFIHDQCLRERCVRIRPIRGRKAERKTGESSLHDRRRSVRPGFAGGNCVRIYQLKAPPQLNPFAMAARETTAHKQTEML